VRSLRIAVVDDDRSIQRTLRECLDRDGHSVRALGSAAEARALVAAAPIDLAFVDLKLGDDDGLALIHDLLALRPSLEIVVITAYGTIEGAVAAIKGGADDFLPKPFTPAQVRHVVGRIGERIALVRRVQSLEGVLERGLPEVILDTRSPAMAETIATALRAAEADVPILLLGESGTGKGVLAQLVHERSARRDHPFVVVSCPNLSDELLASELFGHARGAFTGAVRDSPGKVEAADGGTLFLDEIGEISSGLQTKLLRFLQEKRFERVGETRTRASQVRIVAATNRDLDADVAAGRFRVDLLYRLNVVTLVVPPLRERTDDILPLAHHFLGFFARSCGRATSHLMAEAEDALRAHSWPGNVRELRNEMERVVVLTRGREIGRAALSPSIAGRAPPLPRDETLEQVERSHIARILAEAPTLDRAAEILGIDPSTLWRKRKRYGLTD
jgi:two-component system, NtrC family, response regulator AlgB